MNTYNVCPHWIDLSTNVYFEGRCIQSCNVHHHLAD